MTTYLDIVPLDWEGVVAALISGAIIGAERQLQGRPVGIRTSILICLGAYIFVACSLVLRSVALDPSRVIGQVVSGIGFLGGGVMLAQEGIVYGITSAAAVWILASIGVIIGIGHYLTGIKISVLTVIILAGLDFMDRNIPILHRNYGRQSKYGLSLAAKKKKRAVQVVEE